MSHRQMEEWKLVGTSLTDSHGRLNYCVPVEHKVSPGVHSVKMVVRLVRTINLLQLPKIP